MEKSKEYKISVMLSGIAIALFCVSLITGLVPELHSSIEKICMFLGFAFTSLGFVYLRKSEENSETK